MNQNSAQKFRQSSIVFEKPGILSEKLKTLTRFNEHWVYFNILIFLVGILHTFPMSTKRCSGFFSFI